MSYVYVVVTVVVARRHLGVFVVLQPIHLKAPLRWGVVANLHVLDVVVGLFLPVSDVCRHGSAWRLSRSWST